MYIEDLREFVALARTMHFGKAAKNLYLTQPTLSKHIARLEKALDFRLIDRSKEFKLTEAGVVFFNAAQTILSVFDSARDQGRSLSLSIQAVRVATTIRTARFGSLLRACSRVPFTLVGFDYREPLFSALASGRADVLSAYDFSGIPSLVKEAEKLGLTYKHGGVGDYAIVMMRSNLLSNKEHLSHEDLRGAEVAIVITPGYEHWISCVEKMLGQDLQLRFRMIPLPSLQDLMVTDFENTIYVADWGIADTIVSTRDDVVMVNELDRTPLVYGRLLVYRTDTDNPNIAEFIDDYLEHMEAAESDLASIFHEGLPASR